MLVTHLPRVVDGFMSSQLGAFALDASWLVAGLAFWWPLVIRRSGGVRFPAPMRMLYLFFGTQVHLYIAMWLLLAEFPVYATYELAPRVTGLSALQDQQVAGGLMLGLGGPFVLAAITALFFRWANQEPDMAVPG
jgi:putative copper resistance protein D